MARCAVALPDHATVLTAMIRPKNLPLPEGSVMPCGVQCLLQMGHARLTC